MRKISKNRAEDDTVSSTNGSVTAEPEATNGGTRSDADADTEEPRTSDVDDEPSKEKPADADEKDDKEDTPPPRDPPKKRAAKSRAKEAKKAESEDGDEDEEEYEVEQVVDSKKIKGKLHYLIRWKGYSASSDTWEAADSVSCPELIKKFEESEKKSPKKSLKRGASAPAAKKGAKRGRTSTSLKKGRTSKSSKPKQDFDYESADADAEYEVDKIMEVHHKKNGKREFLIHWKGWSNRYDSWEPEEHLNCSDLIQKFMNKVSSARATEQRELRVAPESTRRFTLAQKSSGRRLSKRSNQRQRVRYDGAE